MELLFVAVILFMTSLLINTLLSELYHRNIEHSKMLTTLIGDNLDMFKCTPSGYIMNIVPGSTSFNAQCLTTVGSRSCHRFTSCTELIVSSSLLDPDYEQMLCTGREYANARHPCNAYLSSSMTRLQISLI